MSIFNIIYWVESKVHFHHWKGDFFCWFSPLIAYLQFPLLETWAKYYPAQLFKVVHSLVTPKSDLAALRWNVFVRCFVNKKLFHSFWLRSQGESRSITWGVKSTYMSFHMVRFWLILLMDTHRVLGELRGITCTVNSSYRKVLETLVKIINTSLTKEVLSSSTKNASPSA